MYRFLAWALTYPDSHFVRSLKKAMGALSPVVEGEAQLLWEALMGQLGELETLPLDWLQGEYTRLFISAYPRVPCPPYESAYREGELMGAAAHQVGALYRQWGLVSEEQPDHAGSELEFLAFLLALGTPESLAAADRFMEEHLRQWLPRWARDLACESHVGFYRVLGELTLSLLASGWTPGGGGIHEAVGVRQSRDRRPE